MPEQSLGQELRRLRVASGMTLAELSARSAVRAAYLAAIEEDREEPSAPALRRVARELEPAGGSYEQLARFLTAPELDVSGEYADDARARLVDPPAPSAGDRVTSVWRGKTDLQIEAALRSIDEYTPDGRRAILAERDRRGLGEPDDQASDAAAPPIADAELQFDRAVTRPGSAATPEVTCTVCREPIPTEYHTVNGQVVCGGCRRAVESAAEPPAGIMPVAIAGVYGFGAAIAGAAVYYAVLAIANLQIGIVAILIGYMVGYAVRKGAKGRGGLRFQILAVVLTYLSVALAYTPVVITEVVKSQKAAPAAPSRPAPAAPKRGGVLGALAGLTFFISILPVVIVFGSLPFGLISGFIIFIGMRQAWRMTAAPLLQVFGPYRVGAAAASGSA